MSDRVAVITGGGSGIGAATARLLVERGERVVLVGRGEDRLRTMQAELGDDVAEVLAIDVNADEAPAAVVSAAMSRWGRIDTLVNNAGTYRHGEVVDMPMLDFDETFLVNVRAPYALTREAVPALKPGSSIVFVGSNLTRVGKPGAAAYSASKAAVESLTKTLAVELGSAGVRVNAVSPGLTRTDMTTSSFGDSDRYRTALAQSPTGYLGDPQDIAHVIAFLSSDAARYVNGTAVVIDGGRILL